MEVSERNIGICQHLAADRRRKLPAQTWEGLVNSARILAFQKQLSTALGGVLTGRGADIIIIDDPLKADDALSESRRPP
jgi:hypothetical protein